MLAKVLSNLPEEEVRPAPPSFTVKFNPNSTTKQFSLSDSEGAVANLVFINEDTLDISITLEGESVAFSQLPRSPIVWSVPPSSGAPELTVDGNTISFTVPKPMPLRPWIFRISVDTPEIKGILSQSIFLAKPAGPQPENLYLHYHPGNGEFKLSDLSDSEDQDGIPLHGQELVLINALNTERTFLVNLHPSPEPLPSPIGLVKFADIPVRWSTPEPPLWIDAFLKPTGQVELQIASSTSVHAAGRCIGFRFVLEINMEAEETPIKVLSPDPILVNTTIGDG